MTAGKVVDGGILLAGIAKDVRRSIARVLNNADAYGRLFCRHKVLIVENGSSDGTKEFLQTWAMKKPNRAHIQADHVDVAQDPQNPRGANAPLLGALRNLYVERIEEEELERYQFVGVFDCDEVNVRPMSGEAILAAIHFLSEESSRAAVLANQRGYYYDIWALRHEIWCPGDCWQEYKDWCQIGLAHEAKWARVGSKQVHIPRHAGPIEVQSGFGGFAIYKSSFLKGRRYRDFDEDGRVTCEHVGLHREIRQCGGRLFVYPLQRNSTPYLHIKRPKDLQYWSTRLREIVT
jgi:hypothetical protein